MKIAYFDPELGRFGLKGAVCPNFYETWHFVQIEHASYEYGTYNWWSGPKIIDSGKLCPNTETCSDFYEILHSQQTEHANYEYNTLHGLELLCDYWLKMIIGRKIRLTFRTWLIALVPRWE